MRHKLFFLFLIFTIITSCKTENLKTAEVTGKRIPITEEITPDTAIANFIKPYALHLNATLDSALAYNPYNLDKTDGELNTALGNLMADVVLEQANPVFKSRTGKEIDFVLLNHGGIRSPIPQGDVTTRTAYNVMPFENEIVVVEISGEKVKEMLNYLESNRTAHPLSGITIVMNEDNKIINAEVKEEEIIEDKNYFVATSDYLQQGGDNMVFFRDPVNLYRTDYKIRNAMIDHFRQTDTIRTKRDNRYIIKNQ